MKPIGPNGTVNQISNLSGLPTITYGVDGEGRPYSVSASSGQNPVSSTSYNTASAATQVNFGSSDSDQFSYDSNTGAMTQYKFNVSSQSVTGALTWNPLGTLASLGITDPFDSSDAQTCNYSHDDLIRISSVNCGSIWSQTFSYDVFGNINKSGNSSFAPIYSTSTNQMTSIGSSTPTYDSDGNVTNDFLNTYAWDSNGRPVTVDSVGITYDALGDMVEQNRSGTYQEIAYAPSLGKLALMSGTTLQNGFVPLTGGATAVYNSSGLAHYRHSDWIGSSRFASTTSQTMYSDTAHAPFGEAYAQAGTTDLSFTGMNQDTATNVYDFPAREYGIQGRWPSPDPAGIAAVNPTDPQTWNRYAYVRNSPLSLFDPTGMDPCLTPGEPVDAGKVHAMCGDDGGGDGFGGTINGPCDAQPESCIYGTGPNPLPCPPDCFLPPIAPPPTPGLPSSPGAPGVGGGGSGSPPPAQPKPPLRPRTDAEYKVCVQQGQIKENQAILQGRVEETSGGLSIEIAIGTVGTTIPTLNAAFFNEGGWGYFDALHAGGLAYAGALAPFVPGFLYAKGILDVTKAYDQYNVDSANCAGPVPNN